MSHAAWPPGTDRVLVEAPARLHFGVLDLNGSLGRKFGGIGAAVPSPSLLLEAARMPDQIIADGEDADRAAEFARRFLVAHGVAGGARIVVHRAIPAHAGLGSGTQLALAVARALADLYDLPTEVTALAAAVGRGRRSAIGTWAFAAGGFLLEGGRREATDTVGPLLARLEMPASWRCVVAVPDAVPGLSGEAEVEAFRRLPPPPVAETERVAHLVLLKLLPCLAEADLVGFGEALTEIQRITGAWFAPAQGGIFAPGPTQELIRLMGGPWGGAGVGQSSWGPAVYGIVEGADAARELAARCRQFLGARGRVWETPFAARGAAIRRVPADAYAD
ncbi:MAG: beta-ribofuranosylaminobenzene 5'-phosphate synthase family protein [Gemmatimonadota bacterium]